MPQQDVQEKEQRRMHKTRQNREGLRVGPRPHLSRNQWFLGRSLSQPITSRMGRITIGFFRMSGRPPLRAFCNIESRELGHGSQQLRQANVTDVELTCTYSCLGMCPVMFVM